MLSSKITVPAPKKKTREYKNPLFCGPGPCDLWPSVAEALTKPMVSLLCDEYQNIIEDIRVGLKYLFQTQSNLVLAINGSGHAGMETVIANLVGPKETMLIASRGTWDERAFDMAKRYGINAVPLRIPFTTTFTFEQVEAELKKLKPKVLFITHGDSSTGTVQKLEGLEKICHKYGALLLVDTVVSIGGVPFFMDEWGVDAVYASSQKALSGPAGISPVAFSARAEDIINGRKFQPPFYFDIKLLALQWNCYGNTRVYGALLLVDTVVSIGGVPFFMDEWGVDAVYASSQKALSGPAGISPVAFSAREDIINGRKFQPPFYFDIKLLALQWNCYGNTRVYHHTMSPPLMWALSSCLEEISNRTLPLCWKQHAEVTLYFHKRLEEQGFKLLIPKIEDRLAVATTVELPQGYDYSEFWKYIEDHHNILISTGSGPTVGKALRIGIMGANCAKDVADAVVDAMVDARKALKKFSN